MKILHCIKPNIIHWTYKYATTKKNLQNAAKRVGAQQPTAASGLPRQHARNAAFVIHANSAWNRNGQQVKSFTFCLSFLEPPPERIDKKKAVWQQKRLASRRAVDREIKIEEIKECACIHKLFRHPFKTNQRLLLSAWERQSCRHAQWFDFSKKKEVLVMCYFWRVLDKTQKYKSDHLQMDSYRGMQCLSFAPAVINGHAPSRV